jgi:hypothetical protein
LDTLARGDLMRELIFRAACTIGISGWLAGLFWSLTIYDDGACLWPNPLDRITVGPRHDLWCNGNGSLDLPL